MSQHHSFDIHLAEKYGVHEAILIHHFEHWISINRKLKKNFKDGRTWTYQTRAEIIANHSYLSEKEVRGAIDRLVEKKVLIRGNFNKTKFDRTVWYAFADEQTFSNNSYVGPKGPMEKPKGANPKSEKGQTIPNTITDTKTDSSSSSVSSSSKLEDDPPPTKEEEEEISKIFSERNQNKNLPKIVSKKKWDQQVLKEIRLKKEEEAERKRNSEILIEAGRQQKIEEEIALEALRKERDEQDRHRLNEIERINREFSALANGKIFPYVVQNETVGTFVFHALLDGIEIKMIGENQSFKASYREHWYHLGDAITSQILPAGAY